MRATYQARISGYAGLSREYGDSALAACGEIFGRLERKLFQDLMAGRSLDALQSQRRRDFRVPRRMFSAARVSVEGKVASVRERQKVQLEDLRRGVVRAEKVLAKTERPDVRHQKKRRLENLRHRLEALESDIESGRVGICFGSKKLWRKQHHLEESGYGSREEWLRDWKEARSGEFFLMGSRDEPGGCQMCVAKVARDGSLTLSLRMPGRISGRYGVHVQVPGVRFKYGHDRVLAALGNNAEYRAFLDRHGEKAARLSGLGQPLSYRFKRDEKGWRVFVTLDVPEVPLVTDRSRGAVGVDVNADHLAVSEVDPAGNWLRSWRVPLVTYGKSQHQSEALIGDAVASVVAEARELGKPIVIERLDFRAKKSALEGESRKYARMLSSFSYGKLKSYFLSRGFREGVEVVEVNPAFSSVIGRVKFMERYGLSVHAAAALVLARRLLGCSERIPRRRVMPVGNGVRVAFVLPARKGMKHVWTHWGAVSRQLRPALAAQHRLERSRGRSNPARAVVGAGALPVGPGGNCYAIPDPFGAPG